MAKGRGREFEHYFAVDVDLIGTSTRSDGDSATWAMSEHAMMSESYYM